MAYLSDLLSRFGSLDALSARYEVSVYGGNFALISGQKGLSSISEEEVVARVKGGKIRIFGENLKVRCASREEVYVSGKIQGVETLYDE